MRRDDLLDLNDVLQHPGRKLEVDVSTELPEEGDLDLVEPLEGCLEAISTGNLLLISGNFKTKAVFECSRCCGPIELPIQFDVDEQFAVQGVPSSLSAQDYARVVSDEPYEMFDGNHLMVEQLLRQALIINLPVQPLCENGWEGNCPQADARGASAPNAGAVRAEFDALKNLLQSDSEEPA